MYLDVSRQSHFVRKVDLSFCWLPLTRVVYPARYNPFPPARAHGREHQLSVEKGLRLQVGRVRVDCVPTVVFFVFSGDMAW